jgi:hypothetical protein
MGGIEKLREAYMPSRRVRWASDVAGLCATLLLIGLLGAAFTWWGRSDFFDLASSSLEAIKIDTGFLVGPILILVALPLVLGHSRQLALKEHFKVRLLIAALLWLIGLGLLIARALDPRQHLHARGRHVRLGRTNGPRPPLHPGDVARRPPGRPDRPQRNGARG